MTNLAGQQFGNYRLTRLLGQGGFAEVYLGEHIELGMQAAVKVLTSKLTPEDIVRFRNEARIMFELRHQNIVRIFEYGLDRNTPFIVMEYAPQRSLRHRHPKGTCVALITAVEYVKQVAAALQYIHDYNQGQDKSFVHRDVKPHNMLIGKNNEILLSDFGITTVSSSINPSRRQNLSGTLVYAAPEQFQRHPVRASDQYALGVTVYEWLCGDPPFESDGLSPPSIQQMQLMNQHLNVAPQPLHERMPHIEPAVEQVVLQALAKKPEERYPSITAFAEALERAVLAHQAAVKSPPISVNPTPTPVRPSPSPQIEPMIVQEPAVSLHKPEDGHPKGAEEQARGAKPASPKRVIDELREYFQTTGNPQFVFSTILYEANNGADEFNTSSKLDYRAYRLNGQGKKEPNPEKAGQGIPSAVQLNLLAFRLVADKLEDVEMGGMRYKVDELLEPEAQKRWQQVIDTLGQHGKSKPSNLTVRAILDEVRKQLRGSNVVQERFLLKTIYASLRNALYITVQEALKERHNVEYDRKTVHGTTLEMARAINRIDISAGGVSEMVDAYYQHAYRQNRDRIPRGRGRTGFREVIGDGEKAVVKRLFWTKELLDEARKVNREMLDENLDVFKANLSTGHFLDFAFIGSTRFISATLVPLGSVFSYPN